MVEGRVELQPGQSHTPVSKRIDLERDVGVDLVEHRPRSIPHARRRWLYRLLRRRVRIARRT